MNMQQSNHVCLYLEHASQRLVRKVKLSPDYTYTKTQKLKKMSKLTPETSEHNDSVGAAESPSGHNITEADIAHADLSAEQPIILERTDLVPGQIEAGGTEIVLQRHGEYIKDREDPR